MSNVVVFDLDGVITSEEAYWMTAGLVLHELLYSPRYWNSTGSVQAYIPATTLEECQQRSQQVLPQAAILKLKARSINSNWDTCYVGVCISLISLLATVPDRSALLPLRPWEPAWIETFRQALAKSSGPRNISEATYQCLDEPVLTGYTGLDLIERLNEYATVLLQQPVEKVFARYGPFWMFCQELFQSWYLGDALFAQEYGYAPAQTGKHGCIYFEQPLLSVEQLRATLGALREQGYVLGVATGRPGREALVPLEEYGLLAYFDRERVVTHAEVAQAEAALQRQGEMASLVKPHPYQFLAAFDPAHWPHQPAPVRGSFVVVGDTPSDVRGGREAGAIVVAVLTGARTPEARQMLEESNPDFIINDVTEVPALLAKMDDLATIQRLQFTEREKSEILLWRWFARHMDLWVERVRLTPRPVSLNSFNGIYELNGESYFFKTHVEEQGVLEEYYHAERLHQAGYRIVRPLRTVHKQGQQMVVYPVVESPVMFDLMRAVEIGQPDALAAELLVAAERRECERLLTIYRDTLAESSADEHARAPIHQLFWHRLTGGRLKSFYAGKHFDLPSGGEQSGVLFEDLLQYRWIINGVAVSGDMPTLGDLIELAKQVLHPEQAAHTIVGHGDAHFGNVFLEEQQDYRYFDPAFAGRHSPLLDIVKPFFHNVYATWMYFPDEVARNLHLSVQVQGDQIIVEHNYVLAPVRQAMLDTKLEHLVKPLVALLRERQVLPGDWSRLMRLALMCCPLLTVNLLDRAKRPAAIGWLGLAQVMQMGNLNLLEEMPC